MVEEHRQVLNVGVAYEYNWDSSFYLHAGFRTDFSYSQDRQEYFDNAELSLTGMPVDFYHLSIGGTIAHKRGFLTLTLDQAFGGKSGFESIVNMRDPVDYDPKLDKRFEGIEESLSKAFVYQVTFIVGYTVVFN